MKTANTTVEMFWNRWKLHLCVKMGGKCHRQRKNLFELKNQQMTKEFYSVKKIYILWMANKLTRKGKLGHKWDFFCREREKNVFVVRHTTVFAILNTFSFETPRWKCFENLLLEIQQKKKEKANRDFSMWSKLMYCLSWSN